MKTEENRAVITYPLVTAIYYKPPPHFNEDSGGDVEFMPTPEKEKPKPEAPEAPEPKIEKVRFTPPDCC